MAKKKLIPLRGENAQVKSSGGEVINIESEPIRPNRFLQDEFDMAPRRRTIEGLAAEAAENQRRRRNPAADLPDSMDMRPSYMRQQAQQPVVSPSQIPMETLLKERQRRAELEMNGTRAQSFNDYTSAVRRARADADGFQQAVERGRGMTHNGLDADLNYTDALGITSRRDKRATAMGALTWRTPESEAKTNSMLSDREKQNYYYLAATQGRQEAENYRQYLLEKNKINEQLGQERYEKVKDASLPTKAVTAFTASMAGATEQTANVGNAMLGRATIKAATPAEHLAQAIEQGENDPSTLRGRVAHKVIQLANTTGTNAPSMISGALFTPGVGSAMFATQAAGAAYQEVINSGGTVQQAQEFAALQAIDEEITNMLLGGIAERGGGLLKKALGNTALARNLRGVLRGAFTDNPVGLHIAEGFINALADGGSEAAQEYVQYFTERLERWLATGEAPTYNVNGEQKTYDQLVAELGQQGALEAIVGNPEAIESAVMGFLNAELMGGVRGTGNVMNRLETGTVMAPDSYRAIDGMVNESRSQYRDVNTYDAGQRLMDLAADQQRRTEAGQENTLASRYGRGLMAEAAGNYQRAVAETEMDDTYNDDEMRGNYANQLLSNLARRMSGRENAIDRTNRIREALRGDNAQAAWESTEDNGVRDIVLQPEMRDQMAEELLETRSADRISWDTEQGAVALDREDDGSYTFTNERGESVTMDSQQAAELIPAGQMLTIYDYEGNAETQSHRAEKLQKEVDEANEILGSPFAVYNPEDPEIQKRNQWIKERFDNSDVAPSINTETDNVTTEIDARRRQNQQNRERQRMVEARLTPGATAEQSLTQLAGEVARQRTEQKQAQAQAVYEARRNNSADIQNVVNSATMLSQAEVATALNNGARDAVRAEVGQEVNYGRSEAGENVSGRGSNGNLSQRTGKQTRRVSAETEAVRRIWRAGKTPADTGSETLRIARRAKSEEVIPGTKKGTSVFIPANQTEHMKNGEAEAKSFGLNVVSWAGGEAVYANGTRFRGMTVPGTDNIYAQADNRDFTQDKLIRHEIAENKLSKAEFEDILKEAREASPIVDEAVLVYQAFASDASDEYGAAKELICDSNGMMNQFERLARENPNNARFQMYRDILQEAIETINPIVSSKLNEKRTQAAESVVKPAQAQSAVPQAAAENNSRMGEFSVAQMAEAMEMEVRVNEDGVPYEIIDPKTGKAVTEVTPQMINNTPFGTLINASLVNKTITPETANFQKKFFADLMTLFIKNPDVQRTWETFGTELFSAIKNNSDKQYGTTIDFGTICAKTQGIINVMSEAMVRNGRGLTRQQIIKVYNATNKAGLSVPCPVCYVFSRWMGVPSLLETMRKCQETYGNMSEAEIQKYVRDLEAKYRDMSLDKDGNPKDPTGKKGIDKRKTSLQNKIRSREKSLQKEKEKFAAKKFASEEKKAEAYKKLVKKSEQLLKEADRFQEELDELVSYNWVTQVLCQTDSKRTPLRNENGDVMRDPDFHPVDTDILLDLRKTGEWAADRRWAKSWTFRNTRGAGMGKAILPYSGASIGDIVRGSAVRWGAEQNPFLTKNSKDAEKAIENAIIRMRAQNLIGGQRLQSTSDFRAEWALDYLMSFMEMQAIGAKGQMYTKVIEAVDLLASSGCEVNMSIMGQGDGYHVDENGKLVLDFSSVTGINFEQALRMTRKYDNAQMILVGLNDTHIKLALADDRIGFIIPWHSSGNSEGTLKSLMGAVNEELGTGTDYTDAQSDKIIDNSEEKKALRQLRLDIVKGNLWENFDRKNPKNNKRKELTLEQRTMLRDNAFLRDLYHRFYMEPSSDEYGTFLNGDQAGQIFPYEYWDKSLTIKDAKQNGLRFQEYCASLGIKPRFTGVKVKGQVIGDFSKEDGYWKLLIDRRMYNRDGTYHEVKAVSIDNIKIDSIPMAVNSNLYNDDARTEAAIEDSLKAISNEPNDLSLDGKPREEQFSTALEITDDMVQYNEAVSRGVAEEPGTEFSTRLEPPPTETAEIYKLMRLDPDGKIRALFIDANGPDYEMGTWYNADAPDISVLDDAEPGYDYLIRDNEIIDSKPIKVTYNKNGTTTSGHPGRKVIDEASKTGARWMAVFNSKTGKRTIHNVGVNGSGTVSTFAYRPGIHAGSLPSMRQIGKGSAKNIRDDRFVWVKGKIAYDAETQAEADRKGGEINDRMPTGGYKYRTNSQADDRISWYISGAFLPERILSDWEADQIVRDFNKKNGTDIPLDYRREGGRVFNAETMKLEGGQEFSRSLTSGMSTQEIDRRLGELVKKYGAMPKGEKPARNVDVPMQTSDNKNTRRFVRTILESGITSEDLDDNIKSAILNESLSYEVATDKDAAEYAASVIRIGGVERAQREWDKARRSDTFNKDHMALGQFLLKEYAKNNDIDNAMNMIQDLAAEGTRMGQNIQAMRMLKKYAQQVPAIGLGYIQRTVDQMNREAKAKMGKRYKEMKIAPNLATEYINAQTRDEIDAALGKIYKNLGSQVQKTIPEEIVDRLRTWRYMSMLGNPRTHIRNLVGNALFVPAVTLKNAIGTGLEGAMKTAEKTKSLKVSKQAMEFAKQDAVEMKDVLSGESEKSIRDLIMDQRMVYKTKALNKASRGNSAYLEKEDWVFLRWHYQNALAQYITANDLDVTEENPAWLGRARKYAVQEAQKATYRDANKVSTWLNQSKGAGAVVKYMMEGLMPFKKTPTNILRRGIEYSPAGLVRTMSKGVYDLNHGKMTVNEWIDALSSGLSGTAIFGVGMFLASTGAILGGYKDDDDKELRKLKGLQEYSVQIGNHTYTIDWAAPGSLPLFIGVETMYALQQEHGMTMDDMGKAAARLVDPMINMSMLSGLNDTLDAISYADDKLSAATMEMFYSLLGQYVPTLFGQVARTIDTTQRINYQDVNTGMSKNMLYFIEKMQNKIPFMTFSNDPYLNEFGQENSGTPHWAAALQNFVSPGYVSEIKDDKVLNEIERLQGAQDSENVLPKKMPKYLGTKEDRVDLTSAQYHTFQKTAGQTAYNILDAMIDDSRYSRMTAEQQANAIKMAYDYAKAVGRIAVQPEYEGKLTGDKKKIYQAVQSGSQAYDAILTLNTAKEIKQDVTYDKSAGETQKGATLDEIMSSNISQEEKGKAYASLYPSEGLTNWTKAGGSSYDYMMGQRLADDIPDGEESYQFVYSSSKYTKQQKSAWLQSQKRIVNSDGYKLWKKANGLDMDFIKYKAELKKFKGKGKKQKTLNYINAQTTNEGKRAALRKMAGY